MSAAAWVRVEYAGQDLTLKQWAAVTGKPASTLYQRIVKYGWPVGTALTAPVSSARRSRGKSPVQKALDLAGDSDWTVALPLAIALMAIQDCRNPLYRDGVRQFFCGGLFEKLFALDGRAVYERLMSLVG